LISDRDIQERVGSVVDVVEATCWTAGADVVELVVVVIPNPASVPWPWKKKRFGTIPVASLDGVGARFHVGTPDDSVTDS